ncbi:erythronolide synthase [Cylindrospermum sp. NIES-4074]|nr:erythronolide synthase [Cylindrospermum sp. NIES-4074]
MEPILAQFQILAASITYNPPQIEIISNLTAQPLTAAAINADYWCRHLRAPVQFAASLETLAAVGYQFFVEIGPKPVLLGMGRHCLPEVEAVWLPSLRPGYDDWQQMLLSLAQLYVHGVSVDWSGFDQNYPRQLVSLPTYPFQRQRYWLDTLNTGHQSKTLSSPEQLETSTVVNLLLQGNIQQLVRQLEAVEDISADEIKLLPKLMEKLVQQHQLTTVSITDKNKASTLIEESSSNSIFIPKIVEIFQYEQLLKSDPGEQKQLLKTYFSQLLAKVAGISQDQLDWQQPLANLGLDSLMIADMRKHMESNLKIIVPVEYFAALSLEEILKQLLLLITGKSIPKQVDSNPEYLLQANIWLPRLQTNSQASFRLFCFPYAGAGASIFYSWIKDLPPEIELCPIQLPGRENRTGESPFTRIKPLIKTLASLLHPHLDIPFAFFGHSLGALLSFELARELRRLNFPAPSYLFVSGSRAPQIPDLDSPIHTLPEPQFKEALQRLNGTPEIILKDSNLMQLFLPALRSDFAMLETYFYTNEKPLECPIFGFGGLNDRRVSSEEIDAWHEQTQSYFKLQMFSDDHFFLHSAQSAMVQTISHEIQKTLILKT